MRSGFRGHACGSSSRWVGESARPKGLVESQAVEGARRSQESTSPATYNTGHAPGGRRGGGAAWRLGS